MTFDQTLIALCEKHGLTRIDAGMRAKFGPIATVWWGEGESTGCAYGRGASAGAAVADAIHNANESRFAKPSVDLPAVEVPA